MSYALVAVRQALVAEVWSKKIFIEVWPKFYSGVKVKDSTLGLWVS